MLFFPYSTALTLAHPPKSTYSTVAICILMFLIQINYPITQALMYYPQSWNPLTMITSSFLHASWFHLLFNMIFLLAFAPAVEAILGSPIHYAWIVLCISFVVGICYSISIILGLSGPLPSLGLSGVVMGFIGLSAFLMPNARIRVFWWYIVFWKTLYIRAWIVALFYIGFDVWKIFTTDNFNGINVVAHIAGGITGYLYGFFLLNERKSEVAEALADEIEEMKLVQRYGEDRGMSMRGRKKLDQEIAEKKQQQAFDLLMTQVYREVSAKRDSEAISLLFGESDLQHLTSQQIETLYNRASAWGPSRTLLCLGRLMIYLLDQETNYTRAMYYIEQCQQISPTFLLPDLSRTVDYAQMAAYAGKTQVTRHLLSNPDKRYAGQVDLDALQSIAERLQAPNY